MPTSTQIATFTAATASAADASAPSTKMGKDDFMKLLMAQLSHQDPSAPMDSNAFVAQLAQFANVEQLQTVNSSLETLLLAQNTANQTAAASWVGKDASYKSDTVRLPVSGGTTLHGELSSDAAEVTAIIKDASGRTVRTLPAGGQTAGSIRIPWDGRDDNGNPLPAGDYSLQLAAASTDGSSIDVTTSGHGRISGVSFDKGYPELSIAGVKVRLSDVLSIQEPTVGSTS